MKLTFSLIACLFYMARAGNILMWMPYGSRSHMVIEMHSLLLHYRFKVVWKPVALELIKRGHTITWIAPQNDNELRTLKGITFVSTDMNVDTVVNSTEVFEGNSLMNFTRALELGKEVRLKDLVVRQSHDHLKVQRISYGTREVQSILKGEQKFDLSVISPMCTDLGLYLAKEVVHTPIALFWVALKHPLTDIAMGNPTDPAYIPFEYFNFGQDMTFLQRVANSLVR